MKPLNIKERVRTYEKIKRKKKKGMEQGQSEDKSRTRIRVWHESYGHSDIVDDRDRKKKFAKGRLPDVPICVNIMVLNRL